ncbi:nitroreductase family deazaflavin-dependent oxidoreductase [Streptomyces sp. NPDC059564]|uniref:nitroreductase family deazaflavin-dependent oxidoreductase n=1 Tax=Streptomyces sp. NPDC059564 TaxID=3346865 RepID=UPI0036850E0C
MMPTPPPLQPAPAPTSPAPTDSPRTAAWFPRAVRRLACRIGASGLFLRAAARWLPVCDLAAYRLTGGRWLPSRLILPTVLLTTTGRRTGRPRAVPVCAHPLPGGGWLVAATNFGRPHHPAWSTNLLHHAHAHLTWNHCRHPVTARLLGPEEQRTVWPRLLALLPVYGDYAARADHREVRVFHLDPGVR